MILEDEDFEFEPFQKFQKPSRTTMPSSKDITKRIEVQTARRMKAKAKEAALAEASLEAEE